MADLNSDSVGDLLGHVALITGAAQGIGKGIAEALLQRQAKVCLVDIKEDVGKETEDYLKQKYGDESVIFVSADVADSEQLKGAFQNAMTRFGRLDIVVNNAGIQQERHWRKMLDINLNAVIEGTFIATDYMRKDSGGNGGVIINVSSVGGLGPFAYKPAYVASKYGVIGFSRSWAINPDVSKNGVRVNVICPGAVDTAIQDYPDDAVYNPELCRKNDREGFGAWMTTEYLAVGFMMLVDQAVSGAVMAVSAEDGYVWTISGDRITT